MDKRGELLGLWKRVKSGRISKKKEKLEVC